MKVRSVIVVVGLVLAVTVAQSTPAHALALCGIPGFKGAAERENPVYETCVFGSGTGQFTTLYYTTFPPSFLIMDGSTDLSGLGARELIVSQAENILGGVPVNSGDNLIHVLAQKFSVSDIEMSEAIVKLNLDGSTLDDTSIREALK